MLGVFKQVTDARGNTLSTPILPEAGLSVLSCIDFLLIMPKLPTAIWSCDMKSIFALLFLSLLVDAAGARPIEFRLKDDKDKDPKFVTYRFLNRNSGELEEVRVPFKKLAADKKHASELPAALAPDQCLVDVIIETKDKELIERPQLDICTLDELILE
jgi:hypothetical protein